MTWLRTPRLVLILALLLSASACSDKRNAEKAGAGLDKGARWAEEQLDGSSHAARQRMADATSRIKDMAITVKVKVRILKARQLRTSDIHVTTRDRVVLLTGTVDRLQHATQAVRIAQGVDDVKSVDSKLAVRSGS